MIRLANNRGAVARNVGVAEVATRYVAFCDDDCWWAQGSLQRAAEILDRCPAWLWSLHVYWSTTKTARRTPARRWRLLDCLGIPPTKAIGAYRGAPAAHSKRRQRPLIQASMAASRSGSIRDGQLSSRVTGSSTVLATRTTLHVGPSGCPSPPAASAREALSSRPAAEASAAGGAALSG